MNLTDPGGFTIAVNWANVEFVRLGAEYPDTGRLTTIALGSGDHIQVVEPFDDVAAEMRRHTERARP